ncbi:hypothetical protein RHS03_01380, partial [Rhizoctonia solani]
MDKMDAPNNYEERWESTPGWTDPSFSEYNQPQFPLSLYDIPSTHDFYLIRPIQPIRRYNYLDAGGEDLASRQYTLGQDNHWEVNEILTDTYRLAAQDASNLPQFTTTYTCAPSDVWVPPPVPAATPYPSIIPISPMIDESLPSLPRIQELASPISLGSRTIDETRFESLPPSSPYEPRSNPETPVTSGPEPSASRRRRRSSASKHTWSCEPCNKTFYRKAELDRHRKTASIHVQKRNFKCQYCGDVFTRPDARGRHERMCPGNPDNDGSPKGKGKGNGKGNGKGKEKDRGGAISLIESDIVGSSYH